MWIEVNTLSVLRTEGEIIAAFPNVSIPLPIPSEGVLSLGVLPLKETQTPSVDHTKNVVELPPELHDGEWRQAWSVVEATAEEIAARVLGQWNFIRVGRDRKLVASDWTQLPDAPPTNIQAAEWALYRQTLRDITTQSDPFNIVWPVLPSAGE